MNVELQNASPNIALDLHFADKFQHIRWFFENEIFCCKYWCTVNGRKRLFLRYLGGTWVFLRSESANFSTLIWNEKQCPQRYDISMFWICDCVEGAYSLCIFVRCKLLQHWAAKWRKTSLTSLWPCVYGTLWQVIVSIWFFVRNSRLITGVVLLK